MTTSRGTGRLYALVRLERLAKETALPKAEFIKRLRHELSELRSELRAFGFDVPLKYGGMLDEDRLRVVRSMRQNGATLKEIARRFGVTHQRIQQILKTVRS